MFEYIKNRTIILFKDIFRDEFNSVEYHDSKFIDELRNWVFSQINKEMMNFEFNDNEFYIKLKNLEKIWVKINNYEIKIIILDEENNDYETEPKEDIILSKDFINHGLFYNNINKNCKHKSKWKIRLNNYVFIRKELKNIEFDVSNIKIKKTIHITNEIIKDFNDKNNLSKSLFGKAIKNKEYEKVLLNYNLNISFSEFRYNYYYNSREINYIGNVNSIEETLNNSVLKNFIGNICITKEKALLLSEFNYSVNLNNILDMTEAFFNLKNHKDSFFYEKVRRDLKNENIHVFFVLVRMCAYNNISEILNDLKDDLNEKILEKFNKLTDALLFILNNNNLLESNVIINGRYLQIFNKKLEIDMYLELGEHELIITETLNSSYKKVNQNHFKFLDVICELMDNEMIKFDRVSAQEMLLKTKKVLLNNKLENNLEKKEVKKKVIKI